MGACRFGDNGGMNVPTPTPPSPTDRLHQVPVHTLARRLGQAGLTPFVVFALLLWVVTEEALPYVALTLVAYAALIVSFLGGIHWGLVWVRQAGVPDIPPMADRAAKLHLLWGVVPSLLAWPGVLMPAYAALPWLGLLLVVCYLVDRRTYPDSGLGHWLTLRFQLSSVAALSCFVGAGAV
jgi:hypothetical protein